MNPSSMISHCIRRAAFFGMASVAMAAGPEIFPVDQIRHGQSGVVYTVLSGTKIEPVRVEIRGVLKGGLGPGRDMIIGRLVDEKTKVMGAVHGMSGSPLYIDDKLAGALSRRLVGFEKDAHCGFTPTADMIDVARRGVPKTEELMTSFSVSKHSLLTPLEPMWEKPAGSAPEFLSIPLQVAGGAGGWNFLSNAIKKWFPVTVPVSGGGRSDSSRQDRLPPIRGGSALSAVLVDGDVSMAGTGTATWVEGDQVVGFGHPMFGMGPSAIPLAPAEIVSVVPSYLMPHKLANPGRITGTMDQDRLSAISGRLGPVPEMATYRIIRKHNGETRPDWEGRLVRHPLLAPQLVAIIASNALMDPQDISRQFTMRVSTRLSWKGQPDLELRAVYTGDMSGRMRALMSEMFPVQILYSQFREILELTHVEMNVETLQKGVLWQLVQLDVEQQRVRVGDSIQVRVIMENDEGKREEKTIKWSPPEELAGETIQLMARGGASLDFSNRINKQLARTSEPAEAIRLLNASFREDAVYLRASRTARGIQQGSSVQTDLPHSIFKVAASQQHPDRSVIADQRIYKETLIPVEGTASGKVVQTLKIEPKR